MSSKCTHHSAPMQREYQIEIQLYNINNIRRELTSEKSFQKTNEFKFLTSQKGRNIFETQTEEKTRRRLSCFIQIDLSCQFFITYSG